MTLTFSCTESVTVKRENPLLNKPWNTPFGIAPFDEIIAEDYLEAFEKAVAVQREAVSQIVENKSEPNFENVILAFDNSSREVDELRDLFEMSEAAISTPEFQAVSEELTPRMSELRDSMYMNTALFEKVKKVHTERDMQKMDKLQKRLTEKVYQDFKRHGADLSEEKRKQLSEINEEIALLSVQFTHNLIASNEDYVLRLKDNEMTGIPHEIRKAAIEEGKRRGKNNVGIFTLSPSSMIPFLTYAVDRKLREEIFTAYQKRGEEKNGDIVRRVTALRAERAEILGYKSHAHYVTSKQIAQTPDAAIKLVEQLWEPSLRKVKEQLASMLPLLRIDEPNAIFEPWDWWYYAEKLRRSQFNISSTDINVYFSAERVRSGAFNLANRLYGLIFRPIDVPIYDLDVFAYEVLDNDNTHLGVLYFDLYARQGKAAGAWCGNLREQRYVDGKFISPVVGISCNFRPAVAENEATLLSEREVQTFFHEFGHALHFLMQDVPYHGLAAVEGDFVEFPSQVLENWAFEKELMRMYALHNRSLQPISKVNMDKIERVKNFAQPFTTMTYLAAAVLDLELHSLSANEASELDLEAFERRVLREDRDFPKELEPVYHLTNFAHLFSYDYSSGYYFYLWADLYAKDAFAAFSSSDDIFDKRWADKLRSEVLERGGELSGDKLYRNFRGYEPSVKQLIKGRGLE